MSGRISPRHAQNPLSGERRKTLSISHRALLPPPLHHHLYNSSHKLTTTFLSYYNVTFVLKSDVKQRFTTTISKLSSLKLGRERSIATLTYKIMHNLAPSYLKDLITSTRNSKLLLPSTRHGLNSFIYKAPRIWKTLPIQTRTASSLPGFKVVIKKWNGYTHMGS